MAEIAILGRMNVTATEVQVSFFRILTRLVLSRSKYTDQLLQLIPLTDDPVLINVQLPILLPNLSQCSWDNVYFCCDASMGINHHTLFVRKFLVRAFEDLMQKTIAMQLALFRTQTSAKTLHQTQQHQLHREGCAPPCRTDSA